MNEIYVKHVINMDKGVCIIEITNQREILMLQEIQKDLLVLISLSTVHMKKM